MRMENASLTELANIFLEVMEGKILRPGTCILVGSLSHLSRVGVDSYMTEWRLCVPMLASKWSGISVCPLFPIHASSLPGNLFGELLILHTWFKSVYAGTTTGLTSCWDKYTTALLEFSEGAGSLDRAEIKTPLLPVNLDVNSSPHTVRFSTSSTSLATSESWLKPCWMATRSWVSFGSQTLLPASAPSPPQCRKSWICCAPR